MHHKTRGGIQPTIQRACIRVAVLHSLSALAALGQRGESVCQAPPAGLEINLSPLSLNHGQTFSFPSSRKKPKTQRKIGRQACLSGLSSWPATSRLMQQRLHSPLPPFFLSVSLPLLLSRASLSDVRIFPNREGQPRHQSTEGGSQIHTGVPRKKAPENISGSQKSWGPRWHCPKTTSCFPPPKSLASLPSLFHP